jgi:hypothetical protein
LHAAETITSKALTTALMERRMQAAERELKLALDLTSTTSPIGGPQ